MRDYDSLSPRQKQWVCDAAKAVYLACRDKTGRAASHPDAVARRCQNMPAYMAALVESLADGVCYGTLSLESLDQP